jgi:hypothetical protein
MKVIETTMIFNVESELMLQEMKQLHILAGFQGVDIIECI